MLDTPAFNDVDRPESDVLRSISNFLGATYSRGVKLSGAVYLLQISATRMSGQSLRSLSLWMSVCGENNFNALVLVTTYWDRGDRDMYLRREEAIRTAFWDKQIALGSKMFRHDEGKISAENIVSYLVQRKQKIVLELQKQLVEDKKAPEETTTGRDIQERVNKQIAELEADLVRIREELQFSKAHSDAQWYQRIRKIERKTEDRIRELAGKP